MIQYFEPEESSAHALLYVNNLQDVFKKFAEDVRNGKNPDNNDRKALYKLATADTLLEIAGQNAGLFISNPKIRTIVETLIEEFAIKRDFDDKKSELILKSLLGSAIIAVADSCGLGIEIRTSPKSRPASFFSTTMCISRLSRVILFRLRSSCKLVHRRSSLRRRMERSLTTRSWLST